MTPSTLENGLSEQQSPRCRRAVQPLGSRRRGGDPGKPFHVQKLRESFHLAGLFLKPGSFRLSLPAGSSNVTATADLPGLPQPRRLTRLR